MRLISINYHLYSLGHPLDWSNLSSLSSAATNGPTSQQASNGYWIIIGSLIIYWPLKRIDFPNKHSPRLYIVLPFAEQTNPQKKKKRRGQLRFGMPIRLLDKSH